MVRGFRFPSPPLQVLAAPDVCRVEEAEKRCALLGKAGNTSTPTREVWGHHDGGIYPDPSHPGRTGLSED